jgi:glycosyltransferase involved in cell wall biosynthesis
VAGSAPLVSVLVPCYDLGEFLDEAVDSALTQTHANVEVIVVDDGSTDEATRALLARYDRPKTRVLHAPHEGLAAARNRALFDSHGEYVCALDADDRLDPAFLERTVGVLEREPSITFASAWLRAFGAETWEWKPERCDLATLVGENTVLTAAPVRREALLAVGGYDAGMPAQGDEDWDLWLRLVERGYRGVIVPDLLFHYRRRAGSMSRHCWHGPGHMPLARYRVAKHQAAYEQHLFDVLLRQDAETAALLRSNDELERRIAADLEPAVALRREELAALSARLASDRGHTAVRPGSDLRPPRDLQAAQAAAHRAKPAEHSSDDVSAARLRGLEAALAASTADAEALRASASWRITAPLRRVYGWWLRVRGAV